MTDNSAVVKAPLRGWSKAIAARHRNTMPRIAGACASAVVFAPIIGTLTTLAWLAASLVLLGVERWVVRPERGQDGKAPRGLTGILCDCVLFMNAAIFAWIVVPMWFVAGLLGGICATIYLGAGLLQSVINGAGSSRVTTTTVLPSAIVALSIPWLLHLNGADTNITAAAGIAVIVFLCVCVTTATRLKRSDQRQARAFALAEDKRREAEQAVDSRSAYLAMIAHDLRTPITAILAGADGLSADGQKGAPPSPHKLAMIKDAGLMMQALLNDLLDHARIDAGRMTVNEQPFDLRSMLAQTARLWGPPIRSKGLRLVIDVDRSLPRGLLGDEMRLRQVLNNLLSNAVKFTQEGTITIRARGWADDQGNNAITLEVADTGTGMSAEQISRVFNRFDQTSEDIAARYGGSGLGLSISHDLVRLMQGRLTTRSRPGHGTAFTVALTLPSAVVPAPSEQQSIKVQSDTLADMRYALAQPLAPAASHTDPASEAPADAPAQDPAGIEQEPAPLRVLVVDDHEINRRAIQLILQPFDCDITVAADGMSALEHAATNVFDVIFMDVRMPELDGRETTRRLRAAGGPNLNTPIIAVTADNSAEDQAACLAAGMNAFVAKPLTPASLIDALEHTLAQQQDRAAA